MKATLYDLVSHRAWAHQKALEVRKCEVPEHIDLGFDPPGNEHVASGENGNAARNGSASVDAMATGWEVD